VTICANCVHSEQMMSTAEYQRNTWYCMHPRSKVIDFVTGKTKTALHCDMRNTDGKCPDYKEMADAAT